MSTSTRQWRVGGSGVARRSQRSYGELRTIHLGIRDLVNARHVLTQKVDFDGGHVAHALESGSRRWPLLSFAKVIRCTTDD